MSRQTADTFKNYINGRWVDARSGAAMESVNPATGEILGLVPRSGPEDVDDAVRAAAAAFPAWRRAPAPRRAEILFRAAERLVAHKEDLAQLMTREMGKILAETRGDVQEAIDGGTKETGNGHREGGLQVLDVFSEWKSVYVDYSGRLQRAQIDRE